MPFDGNQRSVRLNVSVDGDRMTGQQAAHHVEEGVGLVRGHLHFTARDVGQFVQNLHADRAAAGNGCLCPIDF
jgi:hypothetical protein